MRRARRIRRCRDGKRTVRRVQATPTGPWHEEVCMWTKPEYTEMRFGFEVTMYIANR